LVFHWNALKFPGDDGGGFVKSIITELSGQRKKEENGQDEPVSLKTERQNERREELDS